MLLVLDVGDVSLHSTVQYSTVQHSTVSLPSSVSSGASISTPHLVSPVHRQGQVPDPGVREVLGVGAGSLGRVQHGARHQGHDLISRHVSQLVLSQPGGSVTVTITMSLSYPI